MKLFDLYAQPGMWELPYKLLEERDPVVNISHKSMPSWTEHCAYVESRPYLAWYWFATDDGWPAGCVYLSKEREIGIFVLQEHQRKGLASQAIQEIMRLHPGKFLANINPKNKQSLTLFFKLGFDGPIQVTLAYQ